MKIRLIVVILGASITSACGAKQPPLPGQVEQMGMQGALLQFSEAEVRQQEPGRLRAAIEQRCQGPCDRVYLSVGETPQGLLHKFANAVAESSHAADAYLVPPSGKRIELDVAGSDCATVIELQPDGLVVSIDSQRQPPADCERWDASVCRDDDGVDWPRLRSLVGDRDHVCVDLGADGSVVLATLHETLRQPTIRLIQQVDAGPTVLGPEVVQRLVDRHRSEMRWCYDAETPPPPPVRLSVRFIANPDGSIARAVAHNQVGTSAQFEKCLLDVVTSKFRFAESAAPREGGFDVAFEP